LDFVKRKYKKNVMLPNDKLNAFSIRFFTAFYLLLQTKVEIITKTTGNKITGWFVLLKFINLKGDHNW